MSRVFALNKPEFHFIFFGLIGSIVTGAAQPAFGIIFSKVITVFEGCTYEKQADGILLYCMLFLGIGFLTLASNFVQVRTQSLFLWPN